MNIGDTVIKRLVFLLVTLLAAGLARGESINLLGNQFTFAIPSNYCSVTGDPMLAEWEDRTRNAIGKDNRMLIVFVNCKQMQEFRKGKRQGITDYGAFSVQTPKGVLHVVTGIARPGVIASMTAKTDMSQALNRVGPRIKQYIPGFAAESLGWLESDNSGAYFGMLLTAADENGKPVKVIAVGGLTNSVYPPLRTNEESTGGHCGG